MKIHHLHIPIPVPNWLETICAAILLWYRRKQYGFTFRKIRLVGGQYAIVDPEDYAQLCQNEWLLKESRNTCYAWRMQFENGKLKIIYMHREIMQATAGTIVDHQNRNGLDNRKANLQFADHRQNALNCTKRGRPSGSKYRGVCRDERRGKWRAYIHTDLKPKHLGYFDSEEKAARAYDEAAKKYRGSFATLNFE